MLWNSKLRTVVQEALDHALEIMSKILRELFEELFNCCSVFTDLAANLNLCDGDLCF